jgi:cytochrome c oxidase assembly factor CtaG
VIAAAGLLLAGYTGPPELTASTALTSWVLDPGGALLVLVLGLPYVLAVRRVRRSGGRWGAGRVLGYAAGLLGIVVATMSFLGVYAHVLFWVTAVQLALLVTVVPVLLSLGAPVSLLRTASPRNGARAERWLATAPVRLITFPLVAAALVAVVPFAVYFTPVFEASMRSWPVYWLLHAALVVVGLAFFWPVLSVDGDPRLPYAALAAVVLLETLVDSVPGIVLWLGTRLIAAGYYLGVARPWGRSLLSDQQFGGVMLWGIGEVVGLPLLMLVVVQWVRADAREAARIDAALDLAELERGRQGGPDNPTA